MRTARAGGRLEFCRMRGAEIAVAFRSHLAKLMLTNSGKKEALLRKVRTGDGDLGLW